MKPTNSLTELHMPAILAPIPSQALSLWGERERERENITAIIGISFVTQYITYLNIWGALSKTIVFIVNPSATVANLDFL